MQYERAAMSAFGTKQTPKSRHEMSAFRGKADITMGEHHFCI
jgi:hypothetical protein